MNFNRKEHSRFIRYLDRAAEKNPLLWLPCVALIALALAAEHIAERTEQHGAEKAVNNNPQLERKPFFLRAVAMTLTVAFSLMLVPVTSFDVFGEEYDLTAEQVIVDEMSEAEGTTVSEEMAVPEETSDSEKAAVPEDISEPEETPVPEEAELHAEKMVYNEGISPLDDHTHTFHRWEQTEYEHWRVCFDCDRELDRSSHDYAITVVNPTKTSSGKKTFTCTVCGYSYFKTLPPVSHDHEFSTIWQRDTESHWHICINTDCEAVGDFANHSFGEWKNNGSYHWRECSICGYANGSSGYHSYGAWQSDGTNHWRVCTECNYKTSETAHSFKPMYDDTKHWQECSVCGYKKDEAPHSLSDDWLYTDTTHRQGGCTKCGYSTSSTDPHDFNWDYNDDGEHWRYCPTCGWESAKVQHNLVWKHDDDFGAYGQHWQECVCGYEIGWNEHDFNDWEYKSDGNEHWYECNDCGLKIDVEEHDLEWKYTDDEHWRICSECGEKFDTGKHDYKLTHDDKEHWGQCICGRKESIEEHKFAEGIFTLDEGESYDPDDPDSVDDRRSVKRYYCTSYCGYYYDEPITHTHKPGSEWKHDASEHWHECTSCGKKTDNAKHDYVIKVTVQPAGTSAGTRVYTCKVCGYSYDEVIPAVEHVQITGTEWNISYTERLPYITDAAEVRGWVNIAAYINASPDKVEIPITMNGENEMPKEISECIINRDVTLRIKMDDGSVWTVNGLDVTNPKTVNLRVSERSNKKIPADLIDGLISEFETKEYRIHHSGNFGFKAALTLNLSKKYNNYYAELYHYNTKTKQLEFVDESLVKNRRVVFELTHASYYAVTFSSIPLYDDVSSGAGLFENSVPIETSAMPETGGVTIPAVKLPQIMRYSSKKRRYRILKRRRLDDLVFVL